MSKAFTKEDDDGGFSPPEMSTAHIPMGPFRLTPAGARRLANVPDPRVQAALARAEIVNATVEPDRAALGVVVHVRAEDGNERTYRLVSAEERALLDDGCSIQSPVGRALLGAAVGDVRELRAPLDSAKRHPRAPRPRAARCHAARPSWRSRGRRSRAARAAWQRAARGRGARG